MSDIDSVNNALAAHVSAVNSADVDANMAGFTDDTVYMPPNSAPIRGKSELAKMVRSWFEDFQVSIEMVPEETIVSGDWAFQWGLLHGETRPRDGGDAIPMDWKFIYIYRRQPDGSWKIARDIYNAND